MSEFETSQPEFEANDVEINPKAQMRRELDSLHQEMEIAQHGIAKNGQFRRKVPRDQSIVRTRKRKLLERQDAKDMTVEDDEWESSNGPRLRGSMAAINERVIQGSLVFGKIDDHLDECLQTLEADQDDEIPYDEGEDDTDLIGDSGDVEVDEGVDDDENDVDDDDDEVSEEGDDAEKDTVDDESEKLAPDSIAQKPKRRRQRYRLRNFKSQRLAQKHGAALGAHALGRPTEAIQKLKQVARDAPSAPQIYLSLGLVYEDMLRGCQKSHAGRDGHRKQIESKRKGLDANIPDQGLEEQLDLAKKAYGAYHVAAILYKRDYNLWLRAGDSASDIASIHASIMDLNTIPDSVREYNRDERRRWLEEAKHDYQTADNLHPPGIDIPAKLAFVSIELGLFPDALTLLTDLMSSPEFQASYKAWLLYSDLMLRIGYECAQWNRGACNTSNYMFRRWLRKLSKSFDWKERRLQGLSKAMEAACGSQICHRYIQWLKNRIVVNQESSDDSSRWHANADAGLYVGGVNEKDDQPLEPSIDDANLETEQDILMQRNEEELAYFDATTRELHIESDSLAANERNETRSQLLQEHEKSMEHLFAEFGKNSKDPNIVPLCCDNEFKATTTESWEGDLKLSASCKTVSSIASELMRHILAMQLYEGGVLVGEAVSLYFKERYSLREIRRKKRLYHDNLRTSALFDSHQKLNEGQNKSEIDESDTESDNQLSDDDDLDGYDDPVLLQSLERGILPPELKVLYGLSLFGEGGKNFLAGKFISDVDLVAQERRSWLTEMIRDTGVSADSSWLLFQESMTEQLGRTALYALIADVINKSGREHDFSNRVTALFRNHVLRLSKSGIVDDVFKRSGTRNRTSDRRQDLVLKVIVAAARFEVQTTEAILSRYDGQAHVHPASRFSDVLDTLTQLLGFVWKIEAKARISTTCVETVDALSRAFLLLPCYTECILKDKEEHFLCDVVQKMMKSMSIICGAPSLNLNHGELGSTDDLVNLPFGSAWLSPELKRLAVRSFNLCVANNVSLFSGWEIDEFSIRLMRNGLIPNVFGITISDGKVMGYSSTETEETLSRQWRLIKKLLPPTFTYSFDNLLADFQQTPAYRESKEKLESAKEKQLIACYGEDKGLSVMLSFSYACLLLASGTSDENLRKSLPFISLSILIPVSEFCLGTVIWNSDIGRSTVSSRTNLNEWGNFDWDKDDVAPSNRPGYLRPKQRTNFSSPEGSKALHEWFGKENDIDPLSNLVDLPFSLLQREWIKSPLTESETDGLDGLEAMEKLNSLVMQLRSCYSEVAAERVCLNIASSLIDVASSRACQNRFLCIHQASIFASQASKGGTSDQSFHSPLPKTETCTPLNALLTIGRAGCLNATSFHQEAAFLCSFVVSVCSLHRDRTHEEFEWNNRWRIISILTYDLSVAIRHAANVIIQDQERPEDTSGTWEKDVIDELKRARSDGIAWKDSLGIASSRTNLTSLRSSSSGRADSSNGVPARSEVNISDEASNDIIRRRVMHDSPILQHDEAVPLTEEHNHEGMIIDEIEDECDLSSNVRADDCCALSFLPTEESPNETEIVAV